MQAMSAAAQRGGLVRGSKLPSIEDVVGNDAAKRGFELELVCLIVVGRPDAANYSTRLFDRHGPVGFGPSRFRQDP